VERIALINGRVVDGTPRTAPSRATILVEDGLIAAVGADVRVPPGSLSFDLQGATVLPGLIDGHMHVTGMPGLLDASARLRGQLEASELLRECLRRGTTTVGHASGCSENLVLRDMIEDGSLVGRARLRVSGVVTATGGHVRGEGADGPWEVRKVARRMAVEGFDFYKTCATGGFQWAHEALGRPDYTREELEALVAEARMRDRLVHVHAHGQPGLGDAIAAGCHVVLHGAAIDDAALEGIAERGSIFMPTLYITSRHSWGDGTRPESQSSRMRSAHEPHREGVAKAHALGIELATGTDGWPRPGALAHELAELVGCGLTPQEAIVAATRSTARALGIGERVGTLEAGKRADLLVVEGDPLVDIRILANEDAVVLVMKDGRIEVDRLGAEARSSTVDAELAAL